MDHEIHWFREYSPQIILRFCCLFALWLFYGLVPHELPFSSLIVVTFILAAYGLSRWRKHDYFLAYLIFIAAALNTFLAFGINPFFFIVVIYLILVFDIVCTPMKGY